MSKSTVPETLASVFGSDFSKATQHQRLLLLEVVAFALRSRWCWLESLGNIPGSSRLPKECFIRATLSTNEGLKLMAILNVAIVEHYSVEAFNKATTKPLSLSSSTGLQSAGLLLWSEKKKSHEE